MQWDPAFQLALAVNSNPGVYAVLLGSGVSRSAGILTGWEIVLDLIRRIAALIGDTPEPDPASWYRERFDEEPDYDTLLDRLTQTPAERMALLRSYFEPDSESDTPGEKRPTRAHRAIAQLVQQGSVRVILTTNFDRLLEQALEEVGIVPDVISSDDALAGALPYVHSRALIVKLHGDYRDTRIRNTPDELAQYSPAFDGLLDRILDEFGLVVCGWSAKYDTALREAILRCPTRRFATYWLARGELDEEARDLVQHRRAQVVPIAGADEFFTVLGEQLESLRELDRSHPASTQALVQTVKRYLPEPQQRIRLYDLVRDEVEAAYGATLGFDLYVEPVTAETFQARVQAYETVVERMIAALTAIAFYDDGRYRGLITEALQRLLEIEPAGGRSVFIELRKYPAVLTAYATGVAAAAANQFGTLAATLHDGWYRPSPREATKSLVGVLHPWSPFYTDSYRLLPRPNASKEYTPASNHLFDVVWQVLREYVPSIQRYTEAFDIFEYILCLNYVDVVIRDDRGQWAPLGAFLWRYNLKEGRWDNSPVAEFERHGLERGPDWPLLRAGFFNGSPDQFRRTKEIYVEYAREVTRRWISRVQGGGVGGAGSPESSRDHRGILSRKLRTHMRRMHDGHDQHRDDGMAARAGGAGG